ncbi:MAG: AI-2E family transporter [Parcubacteria group bacterium]
MPTENKKVTFDVSLVTFLKAIAIVVGLLFLYLIRDLLLMIIVAIVIASAIDSWIDWLQKKRVPRWLSVILIFTLIIGAAVVIVSLLIPPIIEQAQQLIDVLPEYAQAIVDKVSVARDIVGQEAFDNMFASLSSISTNVSGESFSVFGTISGILGVVFSIVVVCVLSFYFTVQEDSLKKFIRSLAPMKHRPYIENLAGRIQKQIGYWLRGQIMLGLVVGIMLYVGLSLLGVKYALILAILGGLLEIVPYLGPIISAVPAVFLAFTQRPILALFVLILYIVVQQLENHIIVPKVMQRVVGLNPLVTIIVILVGVKVAGILGGILAVPIATAIQVFLSDIFEIKDEKDKEKLKDEICKARAGDMSDLSGKDRKLREELREEVCEDGE